MPSQDKYALSSWGSAQDKYYDFKTPSGQVCLLRKVGLTELLQSGLIDDLDTLGVVVDEHVVKPAQGKRKPQDRKPKKLSKAEEEAKAQQEFMDMARDPEKLKTISRMMDKIIPIIVVKPSVRSPWVKGPDNKDVLLDAEEREDGVVYSDSIDFVDQMALFEEAMGGKSMEDLQQFRNESDASVDDVEDESNLPLSAK
jgi:hypothetical protein